MPRSPSIRRRVLAGISVGSATTGAATWNNGGKYSFEIDSATGTQGTNWDLWKHYRHLSDTAHSPFPR